MKLIRCWQTERKIRGIKEAERSRRRKTRRGKRIFVEDNNNGKEVKEDWEREIG